MPPPRVLAVLPSFIPSTMITIVKPLVRLHQQGHVVARISLEPLATVAEVRSSDVVVFCRNVEPRHSHLLDAALAARIPVIFDLDDNLFEFPDDPATGPRFLTPTRHAMLLRYLRAASLVRVYSEPLRTMIAPLADRIEQVFAPVDLSLIRLPDPRADRRIRIVYATSRWQDDLYRIFLSPLKRLLAEYPDQVEAHFWGPNLRRLKELPGARCHPPIFAYDRFLQQFSGQGFHIGLAPLPDSPFFRCKTNNKFREYGAAGIAGIYSNVEVYRHCVCDGRTGLLVPNDPDAWYAALIRLVTQPALRTQIGNGARQHVETHYSQERFERLFLEHLQMVRQSPARKLAPAPTPPRQRAGRVGHPALRLARRVGPNLIRLAGYLRQHGAAKTWNALRWHAYNWWTLIKLRRSLARSRPRPFGKPPEDKTRVPPPKWQDSACRVNRG